jgi:SAM-dependent methyltransferase
MCTHLTLELNCYNNNMTDDTKLRQTFNQQAQLYNDGRPRYPDALFNTLVEVTQLSQTAQLVEIGPGTGQATEPLARRGYEITAIELGESLADVARHELRDFPNVKVVTGMFENVELPADTFDLVFAATALHWIAPELRYSKPHHILKSDGHLAIIHTHHVSDEQGDVFFNAVRYPDSKEGAPPLPNPNDVKPATLDENLFELVHFERFPVVVTYDAKGFAKLLNTYSPILALEDKKRADFLSDIERLIDEEFEGKVDKHFVMSLTIAKKR